MSKVYQDDLLGMGGSTGGGGNTPDLTWEDINKDVTIKSASFEPRDSTVGEDGTTYENCSFKVVLNGGYSTFIQTDNPYAYDFDAKERGTVNAILADRKNRTAGFMSIIKTFVPMEILQDVFGGLEGTNAKLEAGAQLLTKHAGDFKANLKMYPKFRKKQREFFPIIPVHTKYFIERAEEGAEPKVRLDPKWDVEREIQRELDYWMNWMKENPEETPVTEEVTRAAGEPDLTGVPDMESDELPPLT